MLPPLAAVEIGDSPQTALDPFFGFAPRAHRPRRPARLIEDRLAGGRRLPPSAARLPVHGDAINSCS